MAEQVALVTGFDPYGGRNFNPSGEVATALDGRTVGGYFIVGRTLPVNFGQLPGRIDSLLNEFDPALVIALGLWPGELMIRLERVALNIASFEISDNEGALIEDKAVQGDGAPAFLATLPLRRIESALLDAGIPTKISSTAGTFLCNATLYELLRGLKKRGTSALCGFIHLPYAPAQVVDIMRQRKQEPNLELHQRADLGSMDLSMQTRAVKISVEITSSVIAR